MSDIESDYSKSDYTQYELPNNFIPDPEEEDFEDIELPCWYQVRVTRQQIEALLSKGQVDVEPIEVDCNNCGEETTVFPVLILED